MTCSIPSPIKLALVKFIWDWSPHSHMAAITLLTTRRFDGDDDDDDVNIGKRLRSMPIVYDVHIITIKEPSHTLRQHMWTFILPFVLRVRVRSLREWKTYTLWTWRWGTATNRFVSWCIGTRLDLLVRVFCYWYCREIDFVIFTCNNEYLSDIMNDVLTILGIGRKVYQFSMPRIDLSINR